MPAAVATAWLTVSTAATTVCFTARTTAAGLEAGLRATLEEAGRDGARRADWAEPAALATRAGLAALARIEDADLPPALPTPWRRTVEELRDAVLRDAVLRDADFGAPATRRLAAAEPCPGLPVRLLVLRAIRFEMRLATVPPLLCIV